MKRLDGEVAIITGGGAGLGRGICLRTAADGARVVVADREIDLAEQTAADIRAEGGEAVAISCDVTDSAQVQAMVAQTVARWGKISLLCNNVGMSMEAKQVLRLVDLTEEQWDLMQAVNLKSIFLTSKYIIPEMIRNGGGSIVNIASVAAHHPAFGAAYAAAKAGLLGLSRSIAAQYADDNIRCNTVSPGAMKTPGGASAHGKGIYQQTDGQRTRLSARFGLPEDIGAAVSFLFSSDASYITAADLAVDGGCLAVISHIPSREP